MKGATCDDHEPGMAIKHARRVAWHGKCATSTRYRCWILKDTNHAAASDEKIFALEFVYIRSAKAG